MGNNVDKSSASAPDREFRIVVIGGGSVGKSALTVRFVAGHFVEKYDPTIEDSFRHQCEIDGYSCNLDIMDTAGQEEYSALRDQYMKQAQGFLVVYSVTSKHSFEMAEKLRNKIVTQKETKDFPIVLVANKKDLTGEREISEQEGKDLATKHGILHFLETSAKENQGVTEAFHELVRQIANYRAALVQIEKKKKIKPTKGN